MTGLYIIKEDGSKQGVYDNNTIINLAEKYIKQFGLSKDILLNFEEMDAIFNMYGVGSCKSIMNKIPPNFESTLNLVAKDLAEYELEHFENIYFKKLPLSKKLDVKQTKNLGPDIEHIDYGNGSGLNVYNSDKVSLLSNKYLSQLGLDPKMEIDFSTMKSLLKLYALGKYKNKVMSSTPFTLSVEDFSEVLAILELRYYEDLSIESVLN